MKAAWMAATNSEMRADSRAEMRATETAAPKDKFRASITAETTVALSAVLIREMRALFVHHCGLR